jgi:DNA-binding CsgD family transcriptional regulator
MANANKNIYSCPANSIPVKKNFEIFIPKSKKLFAMGVSVERWILKSGKFNVYWLDRDGYYLGCNDLMAEMAALRNRQLVAGKTNYELIWTEQAQQFTDECENVFSNASNKNFFHYAVAPSYVASGYTTRMPLYNSADVMVGVFGITHVTEKKDVTSFADTESFHEYLKTLQERALVFNGGSNSKSLVIDGVSLTARESACLNLLSKGFSFKHIAIKLGISPRTVETHLGKIKIKLGCLRTTDLVRKMYECGSIS